MRGHRISIIGAVVAGVFAAATPIAGQEAPVAAPAAVPDPVAQVAALREDLVSAQQEIVRLRAELSNQRDIEAALKAAREKNERLVGIANELIAAYGKRYQKGQFLPFDTGRRKFEDELQELGDRAYDSRWDAAPKRTAPPTATTTPPVEATQQPRPDGQ